jgi:hypothetical protein
MREHGGHGGLHRLALGVKVPDGCRAVKAPASARWEARHDMPADMANARAAPIDRSSLASSLAHNLAGSFVEQYRPEERGLVFWAVSDLIFSVLNRPSTSRSLAPVRSKPRRTYDRVGVEFDPEGDYMPSLLKTVLTARNGKDRDALLAALKTYGGESGLFDELTIRRLGDQPGDPFQIQIVTGGVKVNLADVGYGVSQSLPVVVESVLTAAEQWVLIQQPGGARQLLRERRGEQREALRRRDP